MNSLKTIRGRFALWTANLLLFVLLLFGIFVYTHMAQSLTATLDDALRLVVLQVEGEVDVENGKLTLDDNFVEDMRNAPLLERGFSFRVLDNTGQLIKEYGPYHTMPQPEVSFTTPDQPGVFTTFTDSATKHSVRVYTTQAIEDDHVVGTIQVAQNLNYIRQTLNQLLTTLLIAGPLLVVLAGVGGYFLAERALAPINKITEMARHISAKDLSARLNLSPTDDEAGRLASTFDSMLNRLDEAFQRERRFTADASHELRTPLAAMQTILSSTLTRQRTPAKYEQVLADLGEETERLHTLVNGLLHLTRSDATQPVVKEPVDLSILLADVTDSLRFLAEDKGLELKANIADDLVLTGDSDALIRLFVNLLENAIKYTEQGQIAVIANPQSNGTLEVTVSDTGAGIATPHLPHIFNRFYRVDESRTTSGTGLGLAIALGVAQAHGGTIQAESEIGKGTVFTVKLAKK
jgi:heavy metal sensor kinase